MSITVPHYRATIRHGENQPRYAVIDVEADDLRAALDAVARRMEDEVAATAVLVEVRRQADPDQREYV